jgi:hypothetical protein
VEKQFTDHICFGLRAVKCKQIFTPKNKSPFNITKTDF